MQPRFGDASVRGIAGLSAVGGPTNVGKVASALLAKHVRTLEILYSLQKNNAQLRREIQERSGEEEIQRRISEAVAAAVASPNDLTEELQRQLEQLRGRVAEIQQELAATKKAADESLDHASIQMDGLRASKQSLERKCKDLEFEASSQARHASLRGELESQLREVSMALALAEERAADLTRRLADKESTSCMLQLRLKESDEKILAMKAAETSIRAAAGEDKVRLADLERQTRGLRDKLTAADAGTGQLGLQLEQASRELERSREENAARSTKEQELLARGSELASRASTAEAKLSEERKRFQRLRDDAKRKAETEERRYKEALVQYGQERDQLIERINLLSREIESLREHMSKNRSQFSKYVEAKTENTQLKEELDELREMVVVVPRPPHRSHSLGSGSGAPNTLIGGAVNKHVSVERLRHSISVARGHHITSATRGSYGSSNGSSSGGNSGSVGSQASSPAVFQGDSGHQTQPVGSGGGKNVLVRRHSGHSNGNNSGVSGWTGASAASSHLFSVAHVGSTDGGSAGSSGGALSELGARPRGTRRAQHVF